MTSVSRGVVVTGGGRGIGAATARALAATGARLMVAARHETEIETVAGKLRLAGAQAWALRCDVTDPASIANQHMRAHASEGRLFRTVLVDGLKHCDVAVRVVLEREVYDLLGKALRRSPSQAKSRVAALGEGVGRWRAEQKVAAAAAWLVS